MTDLSESPLTGFAETLAISAKAGGAETTIFQYDWSFPLEPPFPGSTSRASSHRRGAKLDSIIDEGLPKNSLAVLGNPFSIARATIENVSSLRPIRRIYDLATP